MSFEFQFILIFVVSLLSFIVFFLVKMSKKEKLLAEIDQESFSFENELLLEKKFKPYTYLSQEEKKQLKDKTLYFLKTKTFFGAQDFLVTPEMKLLIAVQACLLIMNTEEEVYPELYSIFVLPDTYIAKDNPVNLADGLPESSERQGESWHYGPVVLSWKAVANSSVVYHEFAHKLDGEDGAFDGTPNLEFSIKQEHVYPAWAEAMGEAFLSLRNRVLTHRSSDINSYGASNEAEFFAVITEYYVTKGSDLKSKHSKLYDQLDNYFALNPVRWG